MDLRAMYLSLAIGLITDVNLTPRRNRRYSTNVKYRPRSSDSKLRSSFARKKKLLEKIYIIRKHKLSKNHTRSECGGSPVLKKKVQVPWFKIIAANGCSISSETRPLGFKKRRIEIIQCYFQRKQISDTKSKNSKLGPRASTPLTP